MTRAHVRAPDHAAGGKVARTRVAPASESAPTLALIHAHPRGVTVRFVIHPAAQVASQAGVPPSTRDTGVRTHKGSA
jgi:hypothetical protein